jgi:hypothetical protein
LTDLEHFRLGWLNDRLTNNFARGARQRPETFDCTRRVLRREQRWLGGGDPFLRLF